MSRFLISVCIVFAGLLATTDVCAQRLFVLVAADTTDEVLGAGIQQNMKWIRDTFYANVPKERLLVRFLSGPRLNRDSLLASIDQCPVEPDDALLLWWLGPGSFETETCALALPDGSEITSSTIRDHVLAKSARLSLIVIDAYQQSLPAGPLPPKTMEPAGASDLNPAFDSLFFRPCGVVEIYAAQADQRPLFTTRTGGLLSCGLILPPGVLGDVNNEAGFLTLHTPTGEREIVLERGLFWRELGKSIEWDTVLSQLSSATVANYRRALGRKHSAAGQTPEFGTTCLKYADHFVEWQPAFAEFRSRPREIRTVLENDSQVTYQGDRKLIPQDTQTRGTSMSDHGNTTLNSEDTTANELDSTTTPNPGTFEMVPGDHLVEINGQPIRNAEDFQQAMHQLKRQSGPVQFAVVDNMSGRRVQFQTDMDPNSDQDFGIQPWYWKDSLVIIHDVRQDSPAARAVATNVTMPDLPPEVGLGIRGQLTEAPHPLIDAETIVGVTVTSVTDPHRSDLKPGDFVFAIEGYSFNNEDGYRCALRQARLLAGIWLIDGKSGKVEHGHVLLPHRPANDLSLSSDDVMTISITPANAESCPIW